MAFPFDNPDGSSGNTSDTLLPAELFLYVIFNFTFFWRERSISRMHGYLPVCVCARILLNWDVTATHSLELELAWTGFARGDYYIYKKFASQLTSRWWPDIKCAGIFTSHSSACTMSQGFMTFLFFGEN